MIIDRTAKGEVECVKFQNLPWLYLIRTKEELEKFAGKSYHYLDQTPLPCWIFELEHQCDSDFYVLPEFVLKELLKFEEINSA